MYLKDVVTLALENRPEDPIAFASDYLRRVLGGAGAVARAHQYLSLSPHTRRAFTDNALLAFEVLSGDEEGEKPVPGRKFNQLIDALLEDAPSAIAERVRDVLRTTDDAEVRAAVGNLERASRFEDSAAVVWLLGESPLRLRWGPRRPRAGESPALVEPLQLLQ